MKLEKGTEPAFEIVCLGAGGGPLEGDVLGYMCKPYARRWDEGWLGLEGGCGIGALTALLHQAILTKALRRLHEASNHPSPAYPSDHSFSQRSRSSSEQSNEIGVNEPVALHSPPISAVTANGKDINNETFNSKPPQVLSKLGIAGKEQVHVEEGKLFPGLVWPEDYQTPVLKAAWLFSHLTSYLITHAHFDHTLSLVLSTGSLPDPPSLSASQDPADKTCPSGHSARRPIYASLSTLEKLEKVYQGDVWPELGCWAESFPHDDRRPSARQELILTSTGLVDSKAMASASSSSAGAGSPFGEGLEDGKIEPPASPKTKPAPITSRESSLLASLDGISSDRIKQSKTSLDANFAEESTKSIDIILANGYIHHTDQMANGITNKVDVQPAYELQPGVGVQYCPTPSYPILQRIPLRSAISRDPSHDVNMSVQELPVSHGTTTQGNYESSAFFIRISQNLAAPSESVSRESKEAEVLFFGDIESWQTGEDAERLNTRVWQVAAEKWTSGTLRAIFIECSYVGSRPKHLMFGHLAPPCLYAELELMASFLPRGETPPLAGLRIYIQHVKEPLVPEEPIKQKIGRELEELEAKHQLGVQFVCLARGMRILI